MKKFLLCCTLLGSLLLAAAEITVDPAKAEIVVPADCGAAAEFAAKDLQYHLKLITGTTIPVVSKAGKGKYLFRFVKGKDLKPEEARWKVTEKETAFEGDDEEVPEGKKFALTLKTRTGSLSAVADFLERELKVRWLAPGEDGIFYVPSPVLKLQTGAYAWDPGRLIRREIRPDYAKYGGKKGDRLPDALRLDRKTYEKKSAESLLWLKHHRMGRSVNIPFGHSFTQWWKLYGKEHPEYFALVDGKRQPRHAPDRVKMCVSNPALREKIVELWKSQTPRSRYINVCENDSGNYCECPECRKLDVTEPGEKWDDFLTDRYFTFANEVLKLARRTDPKVEVTFYAYSCYKQPPRRVTVAPGVVIGFVPSMMLLAETEAMYKGWHAKGADKLILRPNDQHVNPGLPLGMEKQLWSGFRLGFENGIVGTDYDSCHGFWHATGVADYILARAHNYPQATFEELFDHYCEGFGNAAPEIKEYYTYWRQNVWEKRLIPNRKKIAERGRYGNFRRGLMWDLPKYFQKEDFEVTGKILERAMAKARTPVEKKRIAALQLGHEHEYLTYQAMCAKGKAKVELGQKLLKFRVENRDKLNSNLMRQSALEVEFGDVTGIGKAAHFAGFKAFQELSFQWQFRLDPRNVGEKEGWENSSWKTISKVWSPIYVDTTWENQRRPNVPQELKEKLKDYDGYGWYALRIKVPAAWKDQKVYLYFGGVDESAKVWLNGKLCGVRTFQNENDWKTPFTIEITEQIDWEQRTQLAVVQVHDQSGNGGIWRPVSLVTK